MLIETFAKFGGHSLSVFELIQTFSERASKVSLPSPQGLKRAGLNGSGYSCRYLEGSLQEDTSERGKKTQVLALF